MDLRSTVGMGTISIVIKPLIGWSKSMSTTQPGGPNTDTASQPARDDVPRRLIVTASVAIFAIRDWSLWVLLRDGPWGQYRSNTKNVSKGAVFEMKALIGGAFVAEMG